MSEEVSKRAAEFNSMRMVVDKTELAQDYCGKLKGMLHAVCLTIEDARHCGIDIQFTLSPDANGRMQATISATQQLARA